MNKNIIDKPPVNNPEPMLDVISINYIKTELKNEALTFQHSMNKSFHNFKEDILNIVSTLKEKVSVLTTQMDMIKVVGSTAIGLIVTLLVTSFTLLYNQINNVRLETKAEIKEVRQEMNAKFDKLYDLIANKK